MRKAKAESGRMPQRPANNEKVHRESGSHSGFIG